MLSYVECTAEVEAHLSMLAWPHPRSLSPFDAAQGDPELVEGSRGDFRLHQGFGGPPQL